MNETPRYQVLINGTRVSVVEWFGSLADARNWVRRLVAQDCRAHAWEGLAVCLAVDVGGRELVFEVVALSN